MWRTKIAAIKNAISPTARPAEAARLPSRGQSGGGMMGACLRPSPLLLLFAPPSTAKQTPCISHSPARHPPCPPGRCSSSGGSGRPASTAIIMRTPPMECGLGSADAPWPLHAPCSPVLQAPCPAARPHAACGPVWRRRREQGRRGRVRWVLGQWRRRHRRTLKLPACADSAAWLALQERHRSNLAHARSPLVRRRAAAACLAAAWAT